jgi:hypothetical protein
LKAQVQVGDKYGCGGVQFRPPFFFFQKLKPIETYHVAKYISFKFAEILVDFSSKWMPFHP